MFPAPLVLNFHQLSDVHEPCGVVCLAPHTACCVKILEATGDFAAGALAGYLLKHVDAPWKAKKESLTSTQFPMVLGSKLLCLAPIFVAASCHFSQEHEDSADSARTAF